MTAAQTTWVVERKWPWPWPPPPQPKDLKGFLPMDYPYEAVLKIFQDRFASMPKGVLCTFGKVDGADLMDKGIVVQIRIRVMGGVDGVIVMEDADRMPVGVQATLKDVRKVLNDAWKKGTTMPAVKRLVA